MDTYSPGASAPVAFQFDSTEVRTVDRDGQVWFVADDVAKALAYRSAYDIARVLDADEKDAHSVRTPGGNQSVTILSESGLYHALLKSRKPQARPFRRWVTREVLPAIRRSTNPPRSTLAARLLLAQDESGQWQSQSIAPSACVIDPNDPEQLACFLREYVPEDRLGDVLAIGAQRLLQNRHHPGSKA